MRLFIILTIISFNSLGQRTFTIDKSQADSVELKDYKIYSLTENVEINFIGRQISKSKRFKPTKEESITADNLFKEQYVKSCSSQYYKQFHDPDLYDDSTEIENAKRTYENSYKRIESNAKKDSKKKIVNYDRYFFGYLNSDNEKLILMRFDPHKIKYYSLSGTGESQIDVLTIFVLNLDKKELSMGGWADFKED